MRFNASTSLMLDLRVGSNMPLARAVADILTGIYNTTVKRLSCANKSCVQKGF
jgi:hypothetical protein